MANGAVAVQEDRAVRPETISFRGTAEEMAALKLLRKVRKDENIGDVLREMSLNEAVGIYRELRSTVMDSEP